MILSIPIAIDSKQLEELYSDIMPEKHLCEWCHKEEKYLRKIQGCTIGICNTCWVTSKWCDKCKEWSLTEHKHEPLMLQSAKDKGSKSLNLSTDGDTCSGCGVVFTIGQKPIVINNFEFCNICASGYMGSE